MESVSESIHCFVLPRDRNGAETGSAFVPVYNNRCIIHSVSPSQSVASLEYEKNMSGRVVWL